MFDSLRDKFQTVQEGITASFRGLSVSDASRHTQDTLSVVNYNAGADILHKFQTQWSELHQLSETNATKVQDLDALVGNLHQRFEKQWTDITNIGTTLASVPQLLNSVQQLMEQIGALQELFEDVEAALFQLEDMVETQELQERQLDHRFQFTLYKEKKLGELEAVRVNLAAEHADKVDLDEFKLSGSLPKKTKVGVARGPSLEEVTLEPADSEELDKFLNDSTLEEASSDLKNI
ncbi:hypothetical protein L9F63_000227 [Diploptera punctata]|uniref:Dysbindin n=1 Tax=Diploptera punctata TaxID=6984 RepID=A0AAD8ETK7_DIPPU|nr:hypothetical protein L9F63_000227 [Diploptera punctata]